MLPKDHGRSTLPCRQRVHGKRIVPSIHSHKTKGIQKNEATRDFMASDEDKYASDRCAFVERRHAQHDTRLETMTASAYRER